MKILLIVALSVAAGVVSGLTYARAKKNAHSGCGLRARSDSTASRAIDVPEMTAALAHRFDEVLTSILARTELVIQRAEDESLREWARSVEAAALEGAAVVAQLQQFVRREQIRASEIVCVDVLVRNVVDDMRRTAPHGIVLHLDLQPVPVIEADAAALKQAIRNVIDNALQSMRGHGRVTVSVRTTTGGIALTVRDTGTGMGEEVRKRACEPFFTTKPGSTGLGLTLAYGVALRHGGHVEIESVPGNGTTVRLRLPVHRAERLVPTVRPVSRVGPPSTPPATRRPANCLLVDDDEDVRETLKDILIEGGHHVALARDGDEALALFASQVFDLVITDFAMPKVNGLELAQRCKSLRPSVPVLLLTGCGEAVAAAARPRLTIDAVLSKPVAVGDLLNAVAAYHPQPDAGPTPR